MAEAKTIAHLRRTLEGLKSVAPRIAASILKDVEVLVKKLEKK
jgi:hypothetical protein